MGDLTDRMNAKMDADLAHHPGPGGAAPTLILSRRGLSLRHALRYDAQVRHDEQARLTVQQRRREAWVGVPELAAPLIDDAHTLAEAEGRPLPVGTRITWDDDSRALLPVEEPRRASWPRTAEYRDDGWHLLDEAADALPDRNALGQRVEAVLRLPGGAGFRMTRRVEVRESEPRHDLVPLSWSDALAQHQP